MAWSTGSAAQATQQQTESAADDAVTNPSEQPAASPSDASPSSAPLSRTTSKRKRKQKPIAVATEAQLQPIRPRPILPVHLADESSLPPVPTAEPFGNDHVWLPIPLAMSLIPMMYPVLAIDDVAVFPPPPPIDPTIVVSTLSSLSVAAFVAEGGRESPTTKAQRRARLNAAKRRDQCRTNQARYRTRQRDQEHELVDQVATLKQQVKALEQRTQQLRSTSNSNGSTSKPFSEGPSDAASILDPEAIGSPMEVVIEYFRQFKFGLGLESDRYMLRDELPQYPLLMRRQIAFLYAVVHPDLRLGDLVGVDALVDQWRKYSRYFDDLQLELVDAVVVKAEPQLPGCADHNEAQLSQEGQKKDQHSPYETIQARATLSVIFTDETIRGVFPHLERNEKLRETLVDQRVRLDFVHTFGFMGVDGEAPKVQYLNCFVDFVKAMLAIFQDVDDVATVLQQARIVSGFYLCD